MKKLFILLIYISFAYGQTRFDRFISLSTGDSLDATYYLPNSQSPSKGYPVKIFVHGFGQNKNSDTASARIYAYSNYLTLCYSVRGHGNSSGLSTIMSTQERQDLKEVIQFVENLPFVDTNSIGIIGGSQGGLHALWSVADSLSNCAIADVIVPNWASDLFAQGSIKRMFGILLQNRWVKYSSIRDSLWYWLCNDDYDSLVTYFPKNRDLDTLELLNKTIPLMYSLKYQDHYFEATNGLAFIQTYSGLKKLYLGTGGHFSDSIEEEWYYQFSWITSWFNQFLKNINTGILDIPVYTYAYSHLPMDESGYFQWTRNEVYNLPFNEVNYHRFYFHIDSTIKYSLPLTSNGYITLINNYKDTSYTFEKAFSDNFVGIRFDSAFERNSIVFTTDPLNEDVLMFGQPRAKLFLLPDEDKVPVNIQIYEQDSLMNKYFINRINYVGRNLSKHNIQEIEIKGNFHAHKFKKNNRIRIEITNIDVTNRKVLGKYPFVFPVFKKSMSLISMNSNYPSYIELPILKSDYITRIADGVLSGFKLYQNYPNPFNARTQVGFSLSHPNFTTLKIYDVLGREVAVLVNEYKEAGVYEVVWDASNQPSGVYFYKLQSGNFVAVKKMLLLR